MDGDIEILAMEEASMWNQTNLLARNWSDYHPGNYTDPDDDMAMKIHVINTYLNKIGLPIIVFIGLCGNILAFLVFTCSHLKYQSSSVYLAFLNVADSGFLVVVFVSVWMGYVDVHLIHRQGLCQLIIYVSYLFSFLSVWTVVAFTVERYIVVFYPLKKHQLCTTGRAKVVVGGLVIGSLCIYIRTPLAVSVEYFDYGIQMCMPKQEDSQFWYYFLHVESGLTVVLPCVLIIVLNVRITIRICEFIYRKRFRHDFGTCDLPESGRLITSHNTCVRNGGPKTLVVGNTCRKSRSNSSSSASGSSSRRACNNNNIPSSLTNPPSTYTCIKHTYQLRTTRALVIVSTVFVVLNFPSHLYRLYFHIKGLKPSPMELLWQNFLQMVFYTNFSVNVFLYSACSKSFRVAFLRLCKRWRHSARNACSKLRHPLRHCCCCKRTSKSGPACVTNDPMAHVLTRIK